MSGHLSHSPPPRLREAGTTGCVSRQVTTAHPSPKAQAFAAADRNGATQTWGSGASALSNFNEDVVLLNSTVH